MKTLLAVSLLISFACNVFVIVAIVNAFGWSALLVYALLGVLAWALAVYAFKEATCSAGGL